MFETFYIFADSKNTLFGIGDHLRVLSFLPNIKYNKLIWISDEKLMAISKNINFIDSFKTLNNENIGHSENDFSINLTRKDYNKKNSLFLEKLVLKSGEVKIDTLNLLDILQSYFKISNYKIFCNTKKKLKEKYVFINWHTPIEWQIKRYDYKKFQEIEKFVQNEFHLHVVWQNENDNLQILFEKIRDSILVISVIGLGTHIAMLYDKKLIMLSGPTFFQEMNYYEKGVIIRPDTSCDFRPCNLKNGVNNCGCMSDISIEKIKDSIKKFLQC